MSLTRQTPRLASNPARRFYKAKCGDEQGHFEYYDKEKKDDKGKNGVNVKVDFEIHPFFLIEENLMAITGWNDAEKFSLISNEVFSIDQDGEVGKGILTVTKYPQNGTKSVVAKGTYASIKDFVIKELGGSYTSCMYVMSDDGMLDHIQLTGVAYASWLKFFNENQADIHKYWIKVKEWIQGKKGNVKFLSPVFAFGEEISSVDYEKATNLSVMLDDYLDAYMKRNAKGIPQDQPAESQPSKHEVAFDIKNWRSFKEEGKPVLGSLSIKEIEQLQISLEAAGEVETTLYDCVCQALYDYSQIKKNGTWKEKKNTSGTEFENLSLTDLRAALATLSLKSPAHPIKIYVEAAIEVKSKEEPLEAEVEVVSDNEIPF